MRSAAPTPRRRQCIFSGSETTLPAVSAEKPQSDSRTDDCDALQTRLRRTHEDPIVNVRSEYAYTVLQRRAAMGLRASELGAVRSK